MADTHASTCIQCGREFEAAGTLGEAIAGAQGASAEQLANVRAHRDRFEKEHGGPRGVCSVRCAFQRLLSGFKPPS